MKKIIIIIAAIVVLGGAVGAYFLFFSGPKEEEPVQLFSYTPGEYFVTNVKDANRLLKVTIVLMVDDEKLIEELTLNEFVIRDTVIYKLRQMGEDELSDAGVQDTLRKDLTETLNKVLNIDNIKTIYFNDYVMQ